MSVLTCGFIGLGLIGGSIARALKKYVPNVEIVAYDINREALLLAKEEAVADVIADAIDESFAGCDYLFLCAPVQKNDANLAAVKSVMKPDCLLTDVGSVKTAIHEAVREAGLESRFVGGHPMAGSERVGFASSKSSLLENAYYILTPTAAVPRGSWRTIGSWWRKWGRFPWCWITGSMIMSRRPSAICPMSSRRLW